MLVITKLSDTIQEILYLILFFSFICRGEQNACCSQCGYDCCCGCCSYSRGCYNHINVCFLQVFHVVLKV